MSLSLNNSLSEQGLARPFIVDVFFEVLDLFVKKITTCVCIFESLDFSAKILSAALIYLN